MNNKNGTNRLIRRVLRYPRGYLKYDLTAGLVVFLVAIPLCLGVALASGTPLFSGIISGIIGGIIVGFVSGSQLSVSGPAAGMVAIVLATVAKLGGFEPFLLALLLAGVLQIIIGIFRAGFIADYIPSNVVQGLLCAIGILIIAKQLIFAFTYTADNRLLLKELRATSETLSLMSLQDIRSHLNLGATIISLISLSLLIFFDKTKHQFLKNIPGPVVVVIMGIIINEIYVHFWKDLQQFSSDLVNLPVNGNIADFFKHFAHPDWHSWTNPNIYLYAFILTAVASLEALLNLEAVQKLDRLHRHVSRNRELVAQGIGNTLAGLLGGIPVTSVIVRSSVNIQAGAKTKLSAIVHGLLILVVAMFIPKWINLIPLSSLAAILIYVGYKLTRPAVYAAMYQQGFSQFLPFIITVIAIISTNLLTGVLIGLFFSFFFILRDNSKIQLDVINEQHPRGNVKRMILPQQVSFLNKAPLIAELNQIPVNSHLIIDARYSKYIDRDILEVLDVYKKLQAPSKKIALNMVGFKDHYDIRDHIDFLNVTTYDTQSSLKPVDVLTILKEGNKRFIEDQQIHRNLHEDIKATAGKQHPIAIVLGCIDSRVPVETIFDMGVGDIFVVRIAGNVINDDILASMEFACNIAGAKLIVVLGHTFCGAVKAACDNGTGGHLDHLLSKIKPAVEAERAITSNHSCDSEHFLNQVAKRNIDNSLHTIYANSAQLNRLMNSGSLGLIGAMYDIRTGNVIFQEEFYAG